MLVSRSRVAEKHHLFAKKFLFLIYLRLIGGQKKNVISATRNRSAKVKVGKNKLLL